MSPLTPARRHWLAVTALFLTATAWGASFTVIKSVLAKIPPEPFIFWRFLLAGAILCTVALLRKRLHRDLVIPGMLLGLLVFAGYWSQTRGLMSISSSRSAFLTGLYVVMVPFAEWLINHVRVTVRAWIGSVLALLGTTAIIGGIDARPGWGDLLTIFCAVMFALHIVYSARWTARHSSTGLAAVQVLFVGIAAGLPSLSAPRTVASTDVVAVIIFTAVVTTALAFAAMMWGQTHVTATEAAVILSFEPVAASLTSILWEHEPITLTFVIGAVLILAAMVISQLPTRAT